MDVYVLSGRQKQAAIEGVVAGRVVVFSLPG